MKSKAIYYHAGCPVCVEAEKQLADAIDPQRYELERVHLGENRARVGEAEALGVRSVPALLLNGRVFHVNFGAELAALKA